MTTKTLTSTNGTAFTFGVDGTSIVAEAKGLDLGEVAISGKWIKTCRKVKAANGHVEAYFATDVAAELKELLAEASDNADPKVKARLEAEKAADRHDAFIQRKMDAAGDCAARGDG